MLMKIKKVYDKLRVQENRKNIILLQAIMICIFVLFILPFISFGMNIALKFSKFSYLTAESVVYFLLSPITILILIILIIGVSIFTHIISSAFLFLIDGYNRGKDQGISHCILLGIKETISHYLKKNVIKSIFYTLFAFFLSLPLLIITLFNSRIPYYLVKSLLDIPFLKLILAVLLTGIIIFFYVGIFVLPIGILERKKWKEAYKQSFCMLKGNHKLVIGSMLKVNFLFLLAYGALYFMVISIVVLFIVIFTSDKLAIALFLKTMNQFNGFYFILVLFSGFTLNLWKLYYLYTNIRDQSDLSVDKELIEYKELPQLYKNPKKLKHYLALIGCLSIISIVGYFGDSLKNGSFALEESLLGIQITSHRGNSISAPENTMPAIESAIDELADYAEIDVQETKDGEIVLLHDKSLYRTTGLKKNIWNVTYEELQELDAGSWFSKEFVDVKIPTLEEVLIACKGRIKLNIEVKNNGHNEHIVEKVVALIEEYDFERQCVISSVNLNFLVQVKELNADIKTGYVMSFAYGNFYDSDYVDFFSIKSSFITEEIVREAHKRGKEVHAWTVNTKSEMKRMMSLGIDNIITDRPVRAREVLYGDIKGNFAQYLKLIFR